MRISLVIFASLASLALAGDATAASPSPPAPFEHSCWSTFPLDEVMAGAPSVYPRDTAAAAKPAELVRHVLQRFGDDRFIHRVELGAPPPGARFQGYWRLGDPPDDALWAYISAPESRFREGLTREQQAASDQLLAAWEVDLLKAGLRDEFCAARGRPLAGWSVSGELSGWSNGRVAFLQRFASPSERVFRRRLASLARGYGFRVVALAFLHPFQSAPLLVVETDRDPYGFAVGVEEMERALRPVRHRERDERAELRGLLLRGARCRRRVPAHVGHASRAGRGRTVGGVSQPLPVPDRRGSP